jgi:hypothetical protein
MKCSSKSDRKLNFDERQKSLRSPSRIEKEKSDIGFREQTITSEQRQVKTVEDLWSRNQKNMIAPLAHDCDEKQKHKMENTATIGKS